MRKIKVHQKVIAMILATVVLLTSVPLAFWGFGQKNANAMNTASKEDRRIASEISNETGFSIEEVFNYKLPNRSWNEVLNILKTTSRSGDIGSKNDREGTLLNGGLDETFIKQLKKEGFTEQEITNVRMIEERVMLQLQDITSASDNPGGEVTVPKTDIDEKSSDKEDLTSYRKLTEKIDVKKAIHFMLKLKSEFGSYEKVFDEYLYSIQLGIDLNEYISDKKSYIDKKEGKRFELSSLKVITLEKIEEKSIEMLQNDSLNKNQELPTVKDHKAVNNGVSDDKSPLPDVPKVEAEEVKPKNPTEEVINEIKEISPVKN
jgi:hypothetical protein